MHKSGDSMNFSDREQIEITKLIDICFLNPNYFNELYSIYMANYQQLSIVEIYILEEIFKRGTFGIYKNYQSYTVANPIVYSNNQEIYQTALNLFFGELIFQLLGTPSLEGVKQRQCGYIKEFNEENNGLMSDGDKYFVIQRIAKNCVGLICQIQKIVNNRFLDAKQRLEVLPSQNPFEEFECFNTNVSSAEIFGLNGNHVKRKL